MFFFPDNCSFIIRKLHKVALTCFFIFSFSFVFSQADSSYVVTFDFNEHQIKENDNKVVIKPIGVSLTADRFGNEKSAVYIHGNVYSYLNLGTSELLKPKRGTISLWVKLDRRVYSGKGYDSNPIIATKNGPGEDFVIAYTIVYDCYSKRLMACTTKDSLKEAVVAADNSFQFGKWNHVAITFDSSFFAFYVNGVLQQKSQKDFDTKYYDKDSVVIGHTASKKNERYSQGQFDDIKIFHKVLNDQEILDLYNAPNPNKVKNFLSNAFKYIVIIVLLIIVIVVLVLRNKKALKRQKEQLELINKISELELKVVKSQMNPHFISNCLAAIQELILKNEVDKAVQYLAKFSYFLRQILNYSDKNYITLNQELEIIKLNVELEQLRFKNKFDFYLEIAKDIDIHEIVIPSMLTQPFIENAIWHGLLPLNNLRIPRLIIRVLLVNDFPIIEIEDNGVGREFSLNAKEDSKGTKLVIDKIETLNRLANNSNYKLQIIDLFDDQNIPSGTKVIIQLDHIRE